MEEDLYSLITILSRSLQKMVQDILIKTKWSAHTQQ